MRFRWKYTFIEITIYIDVKISGKCILFDRDSEWFLLERNILARRTSQFHLACTLVNGQTCENLASGKPVIFLFLFTFFRFWLPFFLGGGGKGWKGGDGIDLSGQRTQATWSMKELILALCVTLDSSFT